MIWAMGKVRPALVNAALDPCYPGRHLGGPAHYCGFPGSLSPSACTCKGIPAAVQMSDISKARNKLSFPLMPDRRFCRQIKNPLRVFSPSNRRFLSGQTMELMPSGSQFSS